MNEAARIGIVVDANSSGVGPGLAAGLTAVQSFQRGVTRSLQSVKTAFNSLPASTRAIGGFALAAGLAATALAAVVGPAIRFESAFAGVRKTVEGTPGQLAAIRAGLLDMSRVMPTTADELASIAENAGQLGVKAPDVLEFTRVIAMLGETTDLSFDEAAQSLARFLNITGTGPAGISAISDVIVDLGNNSATTESQIVNFATRLASAFTVAGATEDQILAIAAAFSSMGLRAEAGGSAMSRIITSISDAATGGSDNLKAYADAAGLTTEEFQRLATSQGGAVEAFLLVSDGLQQLMADGQSITPFLESIELGGLRTSEAFRLAALNTELVRSSLARAAVQYAQGGAAQEEYNKRVETTAARLEILKNRLQAVAITAGTPILGAVASSADAAGDAIERLVAELTPLAAAIAGLFTSASGSADGFVKTIGSPALKVGAESLGLVANSLAALLDHLGPVGLGIALLYADILLVGPVSIVAAKGLAALAAAGGGTAGAMALASRGLTGLIAAINPVALVLAAAAVGFVALNKSMNEAQEQARLTGAALDKSFEDGLETGDLKLFASELDVARTRLAELEEGFDSLGLGEKTDAWLSNSLGINLMTGESAALNAELEFLREKLDDPAYDTFSSRVELLAQGFGLTNDQVLETAGSLGITNLLFERSIDSLELLNTGFRGALLSTEAYKGATDELALALVNGSASMAQFLEFTNLTDARLRGLVALLPETADAVDMLFSDDQDERAAAYAAVLGVVNGRVADLERSLGLATGQLLDQVEAVEGLAAAHDALESALAGARSAIEQVAFQENLAAEATDRMAAALDGLDGSDETLRELAEATIDQTLAQAANAASAEEAAASQRRLAEAFVQSGLDAGHSLEDIQRVGQALFDLPPTTILEIFLRGEEARQQVVTVQQELDALERDVLIRLTAQDEATPDILVAFEAARLFGDSYTATLAAADAGSLGLIGESTTAALTYQDVYTAQLEAENGDAVTKTADAARAARAYASGRYDGKLTATDQASPKISGVIGFAASYVGSYNATLTATDSASGVIRGAVAALSAFRSKSITLTTNHVARTTPGNARFADGGFSDGYGFGGGVLERPGRAQIYRPAPYGRHFAEAETGGEAYLPLAAAKRPQALKVFNQVGRMFGVFADGGLSVDRFTPAMNRRAGGSGSSIINQVDVRVDASGSGLDERQLSSMIGDQVGAALREVGRDLRNIRVTSGGFT